MLGEERSCCKASQEMVGIIGSIIRVLLEVILYRIELKQIIINF